MISIDVLEKRLKREFGVDGELSGFFATLASQAASHPLEVVKHKVHGHNHPKPYRFIENRVVVQCYKSTWSILFADLSDLFGMPFSKYRIEGNSLRKLTKLHEESEHFEHGRYLVDIYKGRFFKVHSPKIAFVVR